jgi:predicted acyltransferase
MQSEAETAHQSPGQPAVTAMAPASRRLVSLDALRGFVMFWIVGGENLVHALRNIRDLDKSGVADAVRVLDEQMDHKPWEGFAFYDLIFPAFVFVVGASLVFSLTKTIEQHGRAAAIWRLCYRSVILYIFGLITYGGFDIPGPPITHQAPFDTIRLLGVLQRIAICYFFAGLAFCFLRTPGQVVLCLALLGGYWALMTFVPVPEVGAGNFAEGKNLANYLDSEYLPLRKWDDDHDPEGLLSTLPAIATCLLGVFAGTLLRRTDLANYSKVLWLLAGGAALTALGWLWNEQFPVIKKIWTSSYVLVAGGYSYLLLAAFYLIIDVWKFQIWARPFVWIGMNAITIYMAHHLMDFRKIADRLVGGDLKPYLGDYAELANALVVTAMSLGLCFFLYRRKIFLRL